MAQPIINIRARVREEAQWFRTTGKEAQKRWMRLANLLKTVRDGTLWVDWKDSRGKVFPTFDDYIEAEVGISKSKAYMMLNVVDDLKKLPASKMEELGKTKCYELARLARERPKALERVLAKVEKNPDLTVNDVKDIVAAAIENRALERYERIEFAVKVGDVQTIIEAMAVLQATEPVEHPDTASGRGVHLTNICREFLSDEENIKTLKDLKKSGFFDKVPFELEG